MNHRFTILFLLTSLLLLPFLSFADEGDGAKADSLFARKQYVQALPLYLALQKQAAVSGEQLFRTAVCITEASTDQQKAIELLDKLALQPDAPAATWFYLGEANRRLYRFEVAIDHFNTFLDKPKISDEQRMQADLLIGSCENGLQLLGYACRLKGEARKIMPTGNFYLAYNTFTSGYAAKKPKAMMMAADSVNKFNPYGDVVFFPEKGSTRDVNTIYFSSYGQDGDTGLDIYRIRRIEGDNWNEPENLGTTINTSFDEAFPYICNDGKTLYFASNGHYGMGGYDIYKSVYNASTRSWSTPENIGFPISSPYDDVFFVPDADNHHAWFASARETNNGELTVYKLAMDVNPDRISLSDEQTILDIASFEPPKPTVKPATVVKENATTKGLAESEDYQLLRDGVKLFSQKLTAQQSSLDSLRMAIGYAAPEQQQKLTQQVISGEQQTEQTRSTLEEFQSALSAAEYEFITNGKKPAISDQLRAKLPKSSTQTPTVTTAPTSVTTAGLEVQSPKQAPALAMKPPKLTEADKYRFRTMGKSIILRLDPLPKGVTYKVRIGVFPKEPAEAQFKNLSPITTEKRGSTMRYYAGVFKTYDEAVKALGEVKKKGFKDAVVDAWVNGRPETTANVRATEKRQAQQQAAKEKASGKYTAYRIVVTIPASYTGKDVPTLLNSLADGRDIVKNLNADGSMTYSMGLYAKQDDAEDIKDELDIEKLPNVEVVAVEISK